MSAASLVTAAVTVGLPSRSAPTQLPNRRNAGTGGAARPLSGPSSTWSIARYTAGTSRNSVSSNAVMTVRTSSAGVIPATRSCAVRHSRSTSSCSRRRISACWPAPDRWSSISVSSPLSRRSDATTARRRASVGCAVNTGCTRSPASRSCTWSRPCSAVIRATASASDSRGGLSPESRSRSVRTRCCSSARLAR